MRRVFVVAVLSVVGCGDDGVAAAGTSGDASTGEAVGTSTSGSTSGSSEASSGATADSSSGDAGPPELPPRDEDFEWDEVPALDCGDRGHVVHASGAPANRINLVILGDGYTADELDTAYVEHVDAFLYAMFGPEGFPYDTYVNSFNICRIDVTSAESGTDFPDQGVEVDTALGSWGDASTRLAYIEIGRVEAELEEALATSNVESDWVAVTINTPVWIGSGGWPMLWSGGHDTPEIGVHEAGHTFHALADEYSEGNGAYAGGEPGEINVTADMRSDKWAAWLGYEQEGLGEIGFYEGARYYDTGLWRPSVDGRMRTVTRAHNAPSVDKMIRDIYAIARPVDDFSPKVQNAYPPALGLRVVDETLVSIDWEVDGEVVLSNVGPRIWTEALGMSPGAHEVTAVVRDLTEWVRVQDRSALEMRVTWPVQVPATLLPTIPLRSSAPRAEPRRLRLRDRSRDADATRRSIDRGRPHALDPATRRELAANAELLRAREALDAGRLHEARARLDAHARTFATLHARDREARAAALACRRGEPVPRITARGRFGKTLRRACDGRASR